MNKSILSPVPHSDGIEDNGNPDLPEYCYTVLHTGTFAMLRRGTNGYCPIDVSLAGNPNVRHLADGLNQQLSVTKAQEAAMLGGSMFGWDTPAAEPRNYDCNGIPIPCKPSTH